MSDYIPEIMKFAQRYAARAARRAKVGPGLKHLDQDDLAAELVAEVVKALPNFDAGRGSVEVFFGKVIDDALKMIGRRERGPKARAQRLRSLREHEIEVEDRSTRRSTDDEELSDRVQMIVKVASPEEQEVARLSCDLNTAAIARALGVTRSEVRTVLKGLGHKFGEDFFARFANWDAARRGRK